MLRNLQKCAAALAFVAGVTMMTAAPAQAVMVTYSTVGKINGSTSPFTTGGATLSFTGVTDALVGPVPPQSVASFGTFTPSSNLSGGDFNNVSFELDITQTSPAPGGNISFTASLTGHLSQSASGLVLTFDDPTTLPIAFNTGTTSGTVFYIVPKTLDIAPQTTNPTTTLQGHVNATVVPEPATVVSALVALPLVGLVVWRRRRRTQS